MIHNSEIIELPGSCQHRKYVPPTAATPLQNKSPPRLDTLHRLLTGSRIELYHLRCFQFDGDRRREVIQTWSGGGGQVALSVLAGFLCSV